MKINLLRVFILIKIEGKGCKGGSYINLGDKYSPMALQRQREIF